jgi:putative PEP-CTERM system TPR-repeat lipoprotein
MEKAVALDPGYFLAVSDLAVLDVREKNVGAAVERLERFIATAAQPLDALLLLARIEEGAGADRKTVEAVLDRARAASPRSEQVFDQLIALRARRNDVAGQLAAAEQGLAIAPNNQQFLWTVGDLSLRTGRTDRALVVLGKLAALGKENPDFRVTLGMAQLSKQGYEAALTSFRQGLKLAPQRVDLQVATVEAFVAAARIDEATRMLFEVTQGHPGSPVIGELQADIQLAAKQYPEAIASYREALARAPSGALAVKTGKALLLAKQRGTASGFSKDWLKTHPKDTDMWIFDAQVALTLLDEDRAEADYRKALEGRPDDPFVLNNLAWLLERAGDAQALAYAEKAHSLAPANPDLSDTLGWILVQHGQTKRGVELMASASAAAPGKLDIRLRLAKGQIRDGRTSDARLTLQTLLDTAPESDEARESRSLLATL